MLVSGQTTSASDARAAALLANWKMTPATLYAHLDPSWIAAKWLQYLSLKIAMCVAKGNCGLLISAPPRHGKSLLSTIATPLWVLENFPEKNVVVATYGEELSTDFSRQVRDNILQNQGELSVRLRSDTQRVTNFLTTKGGGLKAVGLRGAITGRGADVFVLDDYIKEPKEAMSPTYLEDLWTWYLTVSRTRLEPGAVVIILATRWVVNDIHGRIKRHQQATGRRFFEYVELPAIAMENDLIGRAPGEVLFPQRYNQQSILDIKTDLGSRWFEAMFQQNPLGDENAAVNTSWFKPLERELFNARIALAKAAKHELRAVRAWDMASTKDAGDFTTGARCWYNKTTEEFYIEDIRRGQYSAEKAELEFATCVKADYLLHNEMKIAMEQEPGSSGKFSIRHFEKIARDPTTGVPGSKVHEHLATNSKLLRAQPLLAAAEAGKVFVVEDNMERQGWNYTLLSELETFPEGAHDDQVDAIAIAYVSLSGKLGLKASFGRSQTTAQKLQALTRAGTNASSEGHRSRVTFGRPTLNNEPAVIGGR